MKLFKFNKDYLPLISLTLAWLGVLGVAVLEIKDVKLVYLSLLVNPPYLAAIIATIWKIHKQSKNEETIQSGAKK